MTELNLRKIEWSFRGLTVFYCRRSDDLDVEVSASGFTKDLASKFDEAAGELNILGGPDNPRVKEEEESESGEESDDEGESSEDIVENIVESDCGPVNLDCGDVEHKDLVSGIETSMDIKTNTCTEYDRIDVDSDKTVHVGEVKTTSNDSIDADLINIDKGIIDKVSHVGDSKMFGFELDCDNVGKHISGTNEGLKEDGAELKNTDDEIGSEEDELADISEVNRGFRPFRNEESLTHVNKHIQKSRPRNSDSTSSTCTSTSSIDPKVIREKLKRQQKRMDEKLKARRIRKSGEAAITTKNRRDKQLDIRQSLGPDWY